MDVFASSQPNIGVHKTGENPRLPNPVFRRFINIFAQIEKFGEKWWGMMILISLLFFVVFSPFFFGGKIFSYPTATVALEPYLYFYKAALEKGGSILWGPDVFSGFAPFVTLSGGFFSPVSYAVLNFFSPHTAYYVLIFISVVLAAFFTSVFLRKIGVGVWPSLVGGLTYVFGQWPLIPDISIAPSYLLLPLLFLLVIFVSEARARMKKVYIFAGIAAVGWAWFSFHWQYLVEILIIGGLFSLWFSYFNFRGSRFREKEGVSGASSAGIFSALKPAFSFFIMSLGGTVIGLVQLIPTFVYLYLSPRGWGFTAAEAMSGGIFNVNSALASHFLSMAGDIFYFVAIIPFFPALFGASRRFFSFRGFFTFLYFLGIFSAINYSLPAYLFNKIPFLNLVRISTRWSIVVSFALGALSAFGLERLADVVSSRLSFLKNKGTVFLRLACFLTVFYFIIFFSFFIDQFRRVDYDFIPGTVSFLRTAPVGRVLPLWVEDENIRQLEGGRLTDDKYLFYSTMLLPNLNLKYGIPSASFFDELWPLSMLRVFTVVLGEPGFVQEKIQYQDPHSIQPAAVLSRLRQKQNLISFLGIRYVVTNAFLGNDFKMAYQTEVTSSNIPVNIFENSGARPIFYFADRVETVRFGDAADIVRKIDDFGFDGFSVFIECADGSILLPSCPIDPFTNMDKNAAIKVDAKNNAFSRLKTRSSTSDLLVFSENHLPGWKAYVDGRETPIYTVGGVFMGIQVPTGEHNIEFRFEYSAILKEFIQSVFGKFNFF